MDDQLVTRTFDVRVSVVGGSTMLVRGRDAYELRDVESEIWSLADGSRTLREITAVIVEQFDVDVDTASRDVRKFLTELHEEGLVELRPAT